MAKEKKDHGDVLIDSFEYCVLHAGAVGGGEKLRRSRARLSDYIASLQEALKHSTEIVASYDDTDHGGDGDYAHEIENWRDLSSR